MIKKYLTTPEEILAIKDTDTKIYVEHYGGYYKFVMGVLCYFNSDGRDFQYQTGLWMSQNPYILVEEPVKEADENDIGKLCWFWDEENQPVKQIGILKRYEPTLTQMRYCSVLGSAWKHCRPLSPSEVAEITGYKVEKQDVDNIL